MNEIFKINYDADQPTVSARDLHEVLEVGTRFNDWFQRMVEYGFTEEKDFYSKMSKTIAIGRPSQDCEVTVDMAKEICMLQRTEKGKRCRTYFIDLEKAWNTPEQIMARALKMADSKICALQEANKQLLIKSEEQKPKVIFADAVSASHTSILIGELAKLIKQNGVEIGQKRLFEWLRGKGYLIKRKGSDWNMPTQKSMEMKLFSIKETVVSHADGHTSINRTPKVTGKGQQYFVNKFVKSA